MVSIGMLQNSGTLADLSRRVLYPSDILNGKVPDILKVEAQNLSHFMGGIVTLAWSEENATTRGSEQRWQRSAKGRSAVRRRNDADVKLLPSANGSFRTAGPSWGVGSVESDLFSRARTNPAAAGLVVLCPVKGSHR